MKAEETAKKHGILSGKDEDFDNSILKAITEYSEHQEHYNELLVSELQQKQSEIDELVEFINRQISEDNFISEDDKLEAIDLIQKHTNNEIK